MSMHVLFVCIHNSARSQMAEALLQRRCGGSIAVSSAGIEPGTLNPLAVSVLAEVGIDIAGKATQSVEAVIQSGVRFDYVITVCDEASAERCPVVPGARARLHWSFADPSAFIGSEASKLEQTRLVLAEIEAKIEEFCVVHCAPSLLDFASI